MLSFMVLHLPKSNSGLSLLSFYSKFASIDIFLFILHLLLWLLYYVCNLIQLLKNKAGNDMYVERGMQTYNNAPKQKEVQTSFIGKEVC